MAEPNWQILLVEDDLAIRVMLLTTLGEFGHQVTTAINGKSAFEIARDSALDIILLDLGLPDLDGKSLIGLLKQVNSAPIIVISARDQEHEKVAALDAGADDYLAKPFGVSELLARMRSVWRRSHKPADVSENLSQYHCQDLSIDLENHTVMLANNQIHVTPVEFRLLAVLARQAGKIITHRQLLREVWGPHHEEDGHYLRIYMRQLRRKIEVDPAEPRYLLNEPGIGYRLAND